ncbi:MAG TPA: iron transporter [Nocardioidaceae bacterium]|nr:iron transporter [Nocardioidaceae bacterium]
MFRPQIAAAAVLPLVALAACSDSSAKDSTAVDVPDGVVEMYETVAAEISDRGGETTVGEWKIGYIVEAAEPWFEEHGGHSNFRNPKGDETNHIEIIPFEAATGRIVPEVPIHVQVLDASGKVVDENDLNFYYATFFHYANNFSLPGTGTYTIKATLGAPTFLRHGDEAAGPALADGAEVEFAGVEITTE